MTYRVTKNDLYKVLNMINRRAGFDPEKDLFNVKGAYTLDFAYGGVRLAKYTGGGGEADILPRTGTKEQFNLMHAFYGGMIYKD